MQENGQNSFKTKHGKQCLMAGVFFVFGVVLVTLGFWNMLLVLALTALGAFLGSRADLRGDISDQVNRVFPPKGQKVTYDAEELEKIKKALELKNNKSEE